MLPPMEGGLNPVITRVFAVRVIGVTMGCIDGDAIKLVFPSSGEKDGLWGGGVDDKVLVVFM